VQTRLSVSMALDALSEQVTALSEAEQTVATERAIRDDLIRDAREAGIGYSRLVKITGLSRDRLYTIVNSPTHPASPRAE
jgi:hypothetical protein